MRKLCAAVLSIALISTSAFAANDGSLAPGKPAGVRQAQAGSAVMMIIAGVAIAAMVLALASGGNGSAPGGGNNQGGSPGSTGTL